MSSVTIQTKNVDTEIRDRAEKIVREAGLSSLQDVIRVMVIDIANGRLPVRIDWGVPKDPEVRKSIKEYSQGQFTTLKKGQKLSNSIKVE